MWAELSRHDPSKLTSKLINDTMKYFPVPDDELWRRGCLSELLYNQLEVPGFTADETKEIVEYLCTA